MKLPTNPFVEEPRTVTGIDIGASAIKLVTLGKTAEGQPEILRVSSYAISSEEGADDEARADDQH